MVYVILTFIYECLFLQIHGKLTSGIIFDYCWNIFQGYSFVLRCKLVTQVYFFVHAFTRTNLPGAAFIQNMQIQQMSGSEWRWDGTRVSDSERRGDVRWDMKGIQVHKCFTLISNSLEQTQTLQSKRKRPCQALVKKCLWWIYTRLIWRKGRWNNHSMSELCWL